MRAIYLTAGLCLLLKADHLWSQATTFNYTGAVQTYTVPSCVNNITVDVRGAEGSISAGSATAGRGGRVQATVPVTPGQILNIYVGGHGIPITGGYNGGGNGGSSGGGGGGASDIRQGGSALTNRVVVGGGGGGAGYNCFVPPNSDHGGNGGGLTGAAGWECNNQGSSYTGLGGTQNAGGAGGSGGGFAGSFGFGGSGSTSICGCGGGGGGGWYGGGSGAFGGGGGGSSYTAAGVTSVVHTQGFQVGDGQIVITPGPAGGPPAPGVISGSTSVCPNSTGTYSITSVSGATSYTWTVPPGATISSGQGTTAMSVNFGSTGGNITVTASNSCGTSAATTLSVAISTGPASPAVPSGVMSRCQGAGTNPYNTNSASAVSYSWTVSGPGNTVTGTTSTGTVTWDPGFNGAAQVCVTAINACGSTGPVCATVTVNPLPAVPAAPSGDTSRCQGAGSGSYSTSSAGAASYNWTVSGSGNSISGNTGSASVSWGPGFTGVAQVCVRAVNTCGMSEGPAVCTAVNVGTPSTPANSAAAAPVNICVGKAATLTANGGNLGVGANWEWYADSCGGIHVGSGNPISIATSVSGTHTYFVRAEGSCNNTACVSASFDSYLALTITPSFTPPSGGGSNGSAAVVVSGGSPPYSYLWSDPSAQTNSTATNLSAGFYTVTVTDLEGCSQNVTIGVFANAGLEENSMIPEPQLYPNPAVHQYTILMPNTSETEVSLTLINALGSVVLRKYANFSSGQELIFDVAGLASGTYFLHITFGPSHWVKKVLIRRD